MAVPISMLFLLLMSCCYPHLVSAILNDGALGEDVSRCARRMQRELDSMRRSAWGSRSGSGASTTATLDLAGYALHQPLRSAPLDMYVTDMRVRVPAQTGWVRVERCQFDPRNQSLDTRLLFSDLTVSGRVKLYEGQGRGQGLGFGQVLGLVPTPSACSMTLRLRHAGLGFTAAPAAPVPVSSVPVGLAIPLIGLVGRRISQGVMVGPGSAPVEVRTNAHFVDPDFVSVYAHGCPAPSIEHRSDTDLTTDPHQDLSQGRTINFPISEGRNSGSEISLSLTREMEDVFLRGIRTLLARYMERRLEPALRDAVMVGIGYSVSYGRYPGSGHVTFVEGAKSTWLSTNKP